MPITGLQAGVLDPQGFWKNTRHSRSTSWKPIT